jgi:hypothetical protein
VSTSTAETIVDLPRTRRLLQARLGLRGPVQIALRIGLGSVGRPTPRRPVSAVLEVVGPDVAVATPERQA